MKVTNPGDREIIAHINPTNSSDPADVKVYVIPAGESVEEENYKVASTLIEHGATADKADHDAARELWAQRNRADNSRAASASASEGDIRARQQATVSVVDQTVSGARKGGLTGSALDSAVKAANEAGAEIPTSSRAQEKRDALTAWQARQGTSTPLEDTQRYVMTEDGELYLDDDEQPVELADVETDDNGDPVFEDGKPKLRAAE